MSPSPVSLWVAFVGFFFWEAGRRFFLSAAELGPAFDTYSVLPSPSFPTPFQGIVPTIALHSTVALDPLDSDTLILASGVRKPANMGLLTILKKLKQKEKTLRLLMLYEHLPLHNYADLDTYFF